MASLDTTSVTPPRKPFVARHPSVLTFLLCLAGFTLAVTLLSEATGTGFISTSFVKTLGKTLCLCLIALAMDLVWGYTGILSLGHFAFFGLGGYMIGMWLMYERTRLIVVESLSQAERAKTARKKKAAGAKGKTVVANTKKAKVRSRGR